MAPGPALHVHANAPALALLLLALAANSCALDSRWFEARRAQRSVAKHAAPTALHATPEQADDALAQDASPGPRRVLRLRAHATARYAAEVTDWRKQLADVVGQANAVLGPTLNAHLELVAAEPWSREGSEDDIRMLLDELAKLDPGGDVDRVLGLAGSVPRSELSFHTLGLGRMPGKHLLARAMNDAAEYEAIERAFGTMSDAERHKLYGSRKRHKVVSVLLHELGHTLDAPHEREPRWLMHPSYDPKEEGYSPATAELMRLALGHELEPARESERAFANAMLDVLEREPETWVATERDALVGRFRAVSAPAAAAPTAPALPPGPPPSRQRRQRDDAPPASAQAGALDALRPPDRATFDVAMRQLGAGEVAEAGATAKALFSEYDDVYAVQDLRCQIAMRLGLPFDRVQAECARMMALLPKAVKK